MTNYLTIDSDDEPLMAKRGIDDFNDDSMSTSMADDEALLDSINNEGSTHTTTNSLPLLLLLPPYYPYYYYYHQNHYRHYHHY